MQQEIIWRIIWTALAFLVFAILRFIVNRFILKHNFANTEIRRRVLVTVRNTFIALLIISVSLIWFAHIRNLAISLAAIAVACVIATKELILCLTGSLMQSFTQTFKLSDRIEINNIRGDVIDMGLTSTTLLEISASHQYTGRAVVIPNSMFFTYPVVNETYFDSYILHIFIVPFSRDANWAVSEKLLSEAATEICSEYLDAARKHIETVNRKLGLEVPSVEPRTNIQIVDKDTLNILVRVPVPSGKKGRIEQSILRRYFEKLGEK